MMTTTRTRTYTPDGPFITPPALQGQIIEVSYALDSEAEVIIERTTDRSDGVVTHTAYRAAGVTFTPWQSVPRLGRRLGACEVRS